MIFETADDKTILHKNLDVFKDSGSFLQYLR
jgi:hypothetical protein